MHAWPETRPIWDLWGRISNQWRVSAGGAPYALDYNPLFTLLDRMGLDRSEWESMFSAVQVIESTVLDVWTEERERTKDGGR